MSFSFTLTTALLNPPILLGILLTILFLAGIWIFRLRITPGVSHTSMKVSLVAIFAAMSLGTDYALAAVPNVKLMDTFVFVAAFLFGLDVGVAVGITSWSLYGFVNPYGPAGPILGYLMIGECFYAVTGALLRRTGLPSQILSRNVGTSKHDAGRPEPRIRRVSRDIGKLGITFGLAGLIGALAYDTFTNTATWFLALYEPSKSFTVVLGQSFFIGLATMNFPLPLGLMHQVSDLFFFAIIAPRAIRVAGRLGWTPAKTWSVRGF